VQFLEALRQILVINHTYVNNLLKILQLFIIMNFNVKDNYKMVSHCLCIYTHTATHPPINTG